MSSGFSSATMRSFNAAAKRINKAARGLRREVVPMGLRMIGEEIMTNVKASRPGHGVPVKDGALRGSGRVEGPTAHIRPRVELTFGGPAAPYALVQHETMHFFHPVGEPRYLVRGMQRWRPLSSPAMAFMKKNANAVIRKAGPGGVGRVRARSPRTGRFI